MIIDTHCHLHDSEFFPDNREAVYQRAIAADVSMVCVGTSQEDSRAALDFVAEHDRTWAIIGVHPHDSKHGWQDIGQMLAEKPAKLIGIGEIGLDYYYDNSPRDVQIKALEQQLQWAIDYNLPVSFHVREAYEDFWPIFANFSGVRGVLHSFTDTTETLKKALSEGLFIGVNGISTFARDKQAMFDTIPLQNMLLETDAPFLTPKPFRGTVNEPAYVTTIAEYHAMRRHIAREVIQQQTVNNAQNLFKTETL